MQQKHETWHLIFNYQKRLWLKMDLFSLSTVVFSLRLEPVVNTSSQWVEMFLSVKLQNGDD